MRFPRNIKNPSLRVFQTLAGYTKARQALTLILLLAWVVTMPCANVQAGDILRGGASGSNSQRNAQSSSNAGSVAAQAANIRAKDRLANTTKILNDMRALQAAARKATGNIPNGLASGGLKVLTGPNAKWEGAQAPIQSGNIVSIKQTASQALLHWETFNVGSGTTVNFDQSAGGVDTSKWIAFNKVFDPAAQPSQIRGKINADGQVYIINQNGIIFGAGSQVNARAFVAAALPINDNLIANGLLNNKDAQFLFSALEVPGGSDGTPTFTPTDVPSVLGDVVVERGAKISSPELAGGNGGRVMLVGANVRNQGEISTPAGQTILAAGLQVGFQAHNSADPSLRGLDAWVGSVGDYAGTITNSGLVEAKTGSILAVGKQIKQSGVLESTTSVNLNGRIDLSASYDAVGYADFDALSTIKPMFLSRKTGEVNFLTGSLTRILPDYESTKSIPGTSLSQSSKVYVDGNDIRFSSGSSMLAPSGSVRIRAGSWAYDVGSDTNFSGNDQRFLFLRTSDALSYGSNYGGGVYFESGALLDVAGSPDVFVPITQNIMDIQLRGNELADYPLQRSQGLRGKTLTVDLRKTGVFGGRFWIGTPLGDVTGMANIIERNVAQMTTRGGRVDIAAGSSVGIAKGSEINVSGGYFRYEGGLVNTTRLIRNGRILDISAATPDVIYDGIYQDSFIKNSNKWGVSKSFKRTLSPMAPSKQSEYIEGSTGGSIVVTAPSVQLEGTLRGNTVTGPKQLNTPVGHSALSFAFKNQKRVTSGSAIKFLDFADAPPAVVLSKGSESGIMNLPDRSMSGNFRVNPSLFSENSNGFGFLTIDNTEGTILVPENQKLNLPSGGSLVLKAARTDLLSDIVIPGGVLAVTSYSYSPYLYAEQKELGLIDGSVIAPNEGHGLINLGAGAALNLSGTIADERATSVNPSFSRRSVDGGRVSLEAYSIFADPSSSINVSGGGIMSSKTKFSAGKGGTIALLAGRDPNMSTTVGGALTLPKTLQGYSASVGGSLNLRAMHVRIGASETYDGDFLGLSPAFFQSGGFTNYSIAGIAAEDSNIPSIQVIPGATIEPIAESFVLGAQNGLKLKPQLLPLGTRSPTSISITGIGFNAKIPNTKYESIGRVFLGSGAKIQTDPRGMVSLSGDTITIRGSIITPAGSITISGAGSYPLDESELKDGAIVTNALTTVHIASTARMLANGVTLLTPNSFLQRTGQVLDGGAVSVSGNILAESGAVIDVSGTSDNIDFNPYKLGLANAPSAGDALNSAPWGRRVLSVRIESSGGLIELHGSQMMMSDATLKGFAGGSRALGGRLSVSSGRFDIQSSAELNLLVSASGAVIPGNNSNPAVGQAVVDSLGNKLAGMGYFAADKFTKGGFDSLDLGYLYNSSSNIPFGGNIQFEGPVTLQASGSIRLAAGGIIQANDVVNISAPYIAVGQKFKNPANPNDVISEFKELIGSTATPFTPSPTSGVGLISLAGQLVDIGTLVTKNIGNVAVTANNGDIRGNGKLMVQGSVMLTAAQVYPTTLSKFEVFAFGDEGQVQISQSGTRSLPMSAGGTLGIYAPRVTNAGTLRAPFGSIILGWDGITDLKPAMPGLDGCEQVALQQGSVTSVSAVDPTSGMGITIPFGLSPDGNSWIDPRGVNVTMSGMPQKRVQVLANSVTQATGATIDLRGGGDLLAYRWISGVGGSADILGTPVDYSGTKYSAGDLVSYKGRTYSARMSLDPDDFNGSIPTPGKTAYWLEIPDSYAILPGFGSEFAPFAPFNSGSNSGSLGGDAGYVSNLKLGDQVVVGASPSLPSGTYTLLPRRYGILPGAYLITPISTIATGYTNAEGASYVQGYRQNAFSLAQEKTPLRANFEVLTPNVLAGRVKYETYSANTFIPKAAADLRTTVSQALPMDSGNLAIHGNTALSLAGSVLSPSISGGRGAYIDISSNADIYIYGGSISAPGGGVNLKTGILNSWNAESLLVGGKRRSTATGTALDVNTSSLIFNSPGEALTAPEVILASKESLNIGVGSSILAQGNIRASAKPFSISGDGAIVRVSSDAAASISRSNLADSTTPSLTIGAGASISGAGVILDSTYASIIDPTVSLAANTLTLGSGQISIKLQSVDTLAGSEFDNHLVLKGDFLSKAADANNVTLQSYRTVDIYGSGSLLFNSLNIFAAGLRGYSVTGDPEVNIIANNVYLSNPNNITSPVDLSTPGSLTISAQNLKLGKNAFKLGGYSSVGMTGSSGLLAAADGSLIGEGAITISAPIIAASQGINYSISATGGLLDIQSLGTASLASGLGSNLSLTGTSVTINSRITLPSGILKVTATEGDITIDSGADLDVAGSAHTFYDITRYADAGLIQLNASAGNISLASGGRISVAAHADGGRAGTLEVSAPSGELTIDGTLLGQAANEADAGVFNLDIGTMPDFAAINAPLESGGFYGARYFRVRSGSVTLNADAKAHIFELTAEGGDDDGSINVQSKIDASGTTGGRIFLSAKENLTLESGSILTVAADKFDSAGKGGEIHLEAGSQQNGIVSASALLDLQDGSTIDLSVKSQDDGGEFVAGGIADIGSSAFYGKFTGKLYLRAPRTADNTGLQINPIMSTITGASAIFAEGYKLYDLTDDDTIAAISLTVDTDVTLANGDVFSRSLEVGKLNTLLRDQIHADNQAFLGTEDDSFANETTFLSTLIGGNANSAELAPLLVVAPGVEIINRTGDLTLGKANPTGYPDPDDATILPDYEALSSADWDLSTMRYGSKRTPGSLTLRAKGDIIFNNSLSDGFDALTVSVDDPTLYSNGLTFAANGHSALWLAQLSKIDLDGDTLLCPVNIQSWSYQITAGADTSSANKQSVLAQSALDVDPDTGVTKGSVIVGEFYNAVLNSRDARLTDADGNPITQDSAGVGDYGTTAANMRINATEVDGDNLFVDRGTRFEVVRTGTGDISLNAARDVQLRNQFATIYTAGVALPAPTSVYAANDFVVPSVAFDSGYTSLGSPSQIYSPQWAMSGGNMKISAVNDIKRVTQFTDSEGNISIIPDSSHQITSNWLYRRGYVDSTTGKTGSIQYVPDDITAIDGASSTTWWIDYSNFFQGFGALGGGNVRLAAGNDVINADAVAPTNARMAGVDPDTLENIAPSSDKLLEHGGGDLSILAGRNIDGGIYYVERGQGRLVAAGEIKTNSTRSPSFGLLPGSLGYDTEFLQDGVESPEILPSTTWLPTTLVLGKGGFEITAQKDVLLGPTVNAFLLPAGLGNKSWYKTYFSTFAPDSSVNVISYGGSITFRNAAVLPLSSANPILSSWMGQQNLFKEEGDTGGIYGYSSSYQPWTRLSESSLTAFNRAFNLSAPILKATALSGNINSVGNIITSPSSQGGVELVAANSFNGLQPAGKSQDSTGYVTTWIASTINVSDANPSVIPSILSPLSYYGVVGASGDFNTTNEDFLNSLNQALEESGSYSGNDAAIDLKIKRHGNSLLHTAENEGPVRIYTKDGNLSGITLFTPKFAQIIAGGIITDVSFYIQNTKPQDISIVSAGGDILPFNESSSLRSLASDSSLGNVILDSARSTSAGTTSQALAGDIQINGPGLLEVLAGRNIDLGTGSNFDDGTGTGITSIGNSRNPNLPFQGASLIALGGITNTSGGAAFGLAGSSLNLNGLQSIATQVTPDVPAFLGVEHAAVAKLNTLFSLIKETGRQYPDTGVYEPGMAAVQAVFSRLAGQGDIFTRARDIRTSSGGSITIAAPKGALTMASDIFGNPLTPPGIVTEYGGSISILTDGDVDIGRARIFTLRGGDMTIWSTSGDIAAGTSPKTVVTAPPTRVLIDTPSADVKTDLGGLATGGGIGVLASVEGVAPGDVYLLAPTGSVDAGDAGIQSTGNLNIAAVAVINADNIAAGGKSSGVPASAPAAAAPASVSPAASSSSAATSSAAQNMASQGQEKKDMEESPSLITVEILGYGGGEGDKEEEDAEKSGA